MITLHFTCDPHFLGKIRRETIPVPGDRIRIGSPPVFILLNPF